MKQLLIILMFFSAVYAQQSREKIAGGFGEVFFAPQFSPDGTMLAFTSDKYQGIWIYKFQDESVTQVTDEIASGFGFSWSQDSRTILTRVAIYEGANRLNAVKTFDVLTGETKNLSGYLANIPALPQWTNDNTKIISYSKKTDLYSTGKVAKTGSSNIAAYALGSKIIFVQGSTGTETLYEPMKNREVINLSLSPDSRKVVFEILGGNLNVMNNDGSGLKDLGRGYRPKWSPDSKTVVYMLAEDDGHSFTSSELYLVNADGSGRKKLTDTPDQIEMNPSFAADGKKIAFDVLNEGYIYIMNID